MNATAAPHAEAPALARLSMHVRHGFFGREGGVSTGDFASLNCGLGVGDHPKSAMENRRIACATIGAESRRLATLVQVHSANAVTCDAPFEAGKTPNADAVVTTKPGLALGIVTADCAPILLCDPHAGVCGAAHAGWRGAVAGVAEAAVEAMVALGAEPSRIVAAIGPCLSQASFEVGPELVDAVLDVSPWAEGLFSPGTGDRQQMDLSGYVVGRLTRLGIGQIDSIAEDTLGQPNIYFSHRHSVREKAKACGRNLSVILLLP